MTRDVASTWHTHAVGMFGLMSFSLTACQPVVMIVFRLRLHYWATMTVAVLVVQRDRSSHVYIRDAQVLMRQLVDDRLYVVYCWICCMVEVHTNVTCTNKTWWYSSCGVWNGQRNHKILNRWTRECDKAKTETLAMNEWAWHMRQVTNTHNKHINIQQVYRLQNRDYKSCFHSVVLFCVHVFQLLPHDVLPTKHT